MRRAARATQAALSPGVLDMTQIPAGIGSTPETREADWMDVVRNGEWVINEGADGLRLTVRTFNGARVAVRMNDAARSPVEIYFGSLPRTDGRGLAFITPSSVGQSGRSVAPINMPTFDLPGSR